MTVKKEVTSEIPTEFGNFKISLYKDDVDNKEHLVLFMGEIEGQDEVLVRVHSECLTGEVFESTKCDCKSQLLLSMKMVANEGTGMIVYLRQEGRGIGLANKLRAYNLQKEGLDTVEANEKLGLQADARGYEVAAEILKNLNVNNIKLITNNPKKIEDLEKFGIKVKERVDSESEFQSEHTREYLKVKKEKMGHIIEDL